MNQYLLPGVIVRIKVMVCLQLSLAYSGWGMVVVYLLTRLTFVDFLLNSDARAPKDESDTAKPSGRPQLPSGGRIPLPALSLLGTETSDTISGHAYDFLPWCPTQDVTAVGPSL